MITNNIKILSISHFCLMPYSTPTGYGGAAFEKPTSALVQLGANVVVISPVPLTPFPLPHISTRWRQYSQVPQKEIVGGVPVYHPRYFSLPKSLLNSLSGYFMFKGLESVFKSDDFNFEFDLIHAHNSYPDGWGALLLSSRYKKPFIVSARGTDIDYTAKSKAGSSKLKKIYDRSAAVICPTPRIKDKVDLLFPGTRSITVCNGIDLDFMATCNAGFTYSNSSKIIITSVCMLIHTKGIDLNLKAIKELVSEMKHIEVSYIIVGDGPARKELEQLADILDLRANVTFTGNVNHDDAIRYISECDIFSMPSWQETFGLVYLEALALGKPVIGCKGQGMDTIITDNSVGLLTTPRDWLSVKSALSYLISNPDEAKEMGIRGSKLVNDQFTHMKNAEYTKMVYEKILQGSLA